MDRKTCSMFDFEKHIGDIYNKYTERKIVKLRGV